MTKELVEDIMALEAKAEEDLAHAEKEKESTIRKAREKAMHIVQEAEHVFDTEREQMIAAHSKTLAAQKQQTIDAAQRVARELRSSAEGKLDSASTFVLERFTEYVKNDLS